MAVFITFRDMLGDTFGVALFSLANSLGVSTETSDGPTDTFLWLWALDFFLEAPHPTTKKSNNKERNLLVIKCIVSALIYQI